MLLSNLTVPTITIIGQEAATVFSSYLQSVHALPTAAHPRQERRDGGCTQTVEVPVWAGLDYNTCSMQTMTAPCSVFFPPVSCHTHLPSSQSLSRNNLSGTTQLWIILGVSIFLVIFIPFAVLWARWKLSGTPRRGGKRSVSVQIEKGKDIKMTSAASSKKKSKSKSTSIAAFGSREQPEAPDGGRNMLDRLLGRNHASSTHTAGKSYITIGVYI